MCYRCMYVGIGKFVHIRVVFRFESEQINMSYVVGGILGRISVLFLLDAPVQSRCGDIGSAA